MSVHSSIFELSVFTVQTSNLPSRSRFIQPAEQCTSPRIKKEKRTEKDETAATAKVPVYLHGVVNTAIIRLLTKLKNKQLLI